MKKSLIALAVLAAAGALSGCASLTQAGNAAYDLQPAVDEKGQVKGYRLTIQDGKEFASRLIAFSTSPNGSTTLVINEGQSKAFRGQGIAAKALNVLPVTGLQDLVGDGK